MKTYDKDNYKLLEEHEVEPDVIIYFPIIDSTEVYRYTVQSSYLTCHNARESIVFEMLQKHNLIQDRFDFLRECYGYDALSRSENIWPDCRNNDFAALTRVIVAIFDLILFSTEYNDVQKLELSNLNKISFIK